MTAARPTSAENLSAAGLRATFDAAAPLTVGVEEELMLLDAATLDLAPRAPELIDRLDGDERFKLEMPAAQIEIALGRSSGGKMLVRIESVVGMIPAAPTPISARDAISSVALPDKAARTEPIANVTSPATRARRRPKRSPSVPAASSRPA